MALISSILALRQDARILKIPPYLSALCIVVGIAWLLVLPLNEYSRNTYVSENALLPGQVHTYFAGSEHNVFRAYRQEVWAMREEGEEQRSQKLGDIFRSNNLKVATQKYAYHVSNRTIAGENVYAILQGPRADATEALVLIGAWTNMDGEVNTSGVALVLTLARYFKRWSLWSKDIIFLISGDSTTGPQAWVDAYHNGHDPRYVSGLDIKSGALQGAVAVDYPAGPWGHRYDKLHVQYDGINGQLPNLDLFNTAVQIASSQMGIGCAIQRMFNHHDSYAERLETMLRGMVSQGLGHATGPHSSFIPYHVDAITLTTVGDGWHDEMSLGKTIESLFRSLNNLLEHLHQSFFFYLLIQANRFISIGTYLPSAMLIAVNFSIAAIGLWIASGRPDPESLPKPGATQPPAKTKAESKEESKTMQPDTSPAQTKEQEQEHSEPTLQLISKDNAHTLLPAALLQTPPRPLSTPLLLLLTIHLTSLIPLYLFTNWDHIQLGRLHIAFANSSTLAPLAISWLLSELRPLTRQEVEIFQSFSLLGLGMFLAALATLNFSQSFLIGIFCAPLSFVRRTSSTTVTVVQLLVLAGLNPLLVATWSSGLAGWDLTALLVDAVDGWGVSGVWTLGVVWGVWMPAWVVGVVVVAGGVMEGGLL